MNALRRRMMNLKGVKIYTTGSVVSHQPDGRLPFTLPSSWYEPIFSKNLPERPVFVSLPEEKPEKVVFGTGSRFPSSSQGGVEPITSADSAEPAESISLTREHRKECFPTMLQGWIETPSGVHNRPSSPLIYFDLTVNQRG